MLAFLHRHHFDVKARTESSRRLFPEARFNVHSDVHALLKVGVLRRDEDGRVVFPYDAIHVDFMLRAA